MEQKYKYLAKNTALLTLSSFGSKFLSFLLVPLYTAVLTTAEYGVADLISTSVMLLGYIFTLNISDSVLRFGIDDKKRAIEIMGFSIRIILYGTVILYTVLLVLAMCHIVDIKNYVYLYLALYYLFFVFFSLFQSYLRAVDNIKAVAISGIITTAGTIISNIVLLLIFNIGIHGYLISMIVGVALACTYQLFNVKDSRLILNIKECNLDHSEKRVLLAYSFPLIFNGIAWWINSSLDKYFIVGMLGAGANGIYSVAYKIPTILSMVQTVFNQAWNLSAIREFDVNDSDSFFAKIYNSYNSAMVISCCVLILSNRFIASLLFAKDFYQAWRYAPVLLLSTLFSALSGFVGSIFSAVKKSKIFAVSTILAAITNCILNALLIPIYGVMGAAIATVISFVIIWAVRLVYSFKFINWHLKLARDMLAYFFLSIQVLLACNQEPRYWAQCAIVCLEIVLFHKDLIGVLHKLLGVIRHRLNRK